jgi:probable F420-dependent oxidoreductase
VGIQLPEVERDVRWPEYAMLARAAEAAGFDSVALGDHLLYRGDGRPERGPWEAWTMLAALAAVTERVALSPLVACTGFHNPAMLAKMAATVDEVSGGRLVLGLGAGWNEVEFRAFGFPFDHRATRFEESFEIVRRLLDGDRVSFAGRFWSVDDAVLHPRPSRRPPLMIGSTGPRILAAALPHADIWNTWYDAYGNTAEGFATLNRTVTEAAGRAGRRPEDIERSACIRVILDSSVPERPVEAGLDPLEGPPPRVAAGLRAFADAGADEAILVVTPITEASFENLAEVLALLDG